MPKRRQIPFLRSDRTLADGRTVYDWKPSKALIDAGWEYRQLGTDEHEAVRIAIDLNKRVAEWRKSSKEGNQSGNRATSKPMPRVIRWDGLEDRFRASEDWKKLAPATKAEYSSRLRAIRTWALDGQLPLSAITRERVETFYTELKQGKSSVHRAAAIMRVLRLTLSFAERKSLIPRGSNPAREQRVAAPPARRNHYTPDEVNLIVNEADKAGLPNIALSIDLAFWTLQRQSDLLAGFNRLAWREFSNLDARDAAMLANERGKVMGFRFRQIKTGVWIDAPIPPHYHAAIEARWATGAQQLFADDMADDARPLKAWRMQRLFRKVRDLAAAQLVDNGDHGRAQQLQSGQFRDLRRSGMMFMRDCGAKKEWITSLSGHSILQRKSIMDTYMPADTPAACAAVATAMRWAARQEDIENKI